MGVKEEGAELENRVLIEPLRNSFLSTFLLLVRWEIEQKETPHRPKCLQREGNACGVSLSPSIDVVYVLCVSTFPLKGSVKKKHNSIGCIAKFHQRGKRKKTKDQSQNVLVDDEKRRSFAFICCTFLWIIFALWHSVQAWRF